MDRTGTASVHDVLQDQARRHPDREAFVVLDADGARHAITFAELLEQVERAAVALRDVGVAPGDAVVVHLATSLEFLTCWFALLRLGALAVPTNLASPAREITHAMLTTGATHVITEPRHGQLFDDVAAGPATVETRILARTDGATRSEGVHVLDELLAAVTPGTTLPDPGPSGRDPAQVLFTSGTTSAPKGALLSHANLLRAGLRVSLHYRIASGDRPLSVMPLFHTGGQCMGVMAALVVGATGVLVERYSASRFFAQARAERTTFVMLVTTHVRTLLAQEPRDDDPEHHFTSMGFGLRITDDERDAFEARFGVRLTYCYGQTEACLNIAIAPLDGDRRWPSLGPPAFDRVVRIVDADDADVPAGEVGEILVEADPGRTVLLGYVNDPEATASTLRGGWLHTGDNGRFDERGHLHFVDRKKDMIKRAGENISALEVETALTAHPDIEEAAVIGIPDEIRDEAVKAYVIVRTGASLTVEQVQDHCGEYLATFKVPTVVEFRVDLPRTSIGKIAKKQLRTT